MLQGGNFYNNLINNYSIVRIASMLQQEATCYNDLFNTNNFNVTGRHSFSNNQDMLQQSMRITLMLQQETSFNNEDNAIINANDFNVTADYFYNEDNATISADNFNCYSRI